jgi:hypothetical protein
MRPLLATCALLALVIATPTARAAAPGLHAIAQTLSPTNVSYAKNKSVKGWKAKNVKRGGPPPWAPAHGLRRKRGW